jgi:hypothetical protein
MKQNVGSYSHATSSSHRHEERGSRCWAEAEAGRSARALALRGYRHSRPRRTARTHLAQDKPRRGWRETRNSRRGAPATPKKHARASPTGSCYKVLRSPAPGRLCPNEVATLHVISVGAIEVRFCGRRVVLVHGNFPGSARRYNVARTGPHLRCHIASDPGSPRQTYSTSSAKRWQKIREKGATG